MNREYLDKGVKKGKFLCRCTKVGNFEINKNANEETNAFLRNFKLPTMLARTYDPFNVVKYALKNMRGYNLPPTKPMWEEVVIFDRLNEDIYRERMMKCRGIVSFE